MENGACKTLGSHISTSFQANLIILNDLESSCSALQLCSAELTKKWLALRAIAVGSGGLIVVVALVRFP